MFNNKIYFIESNIWQVSFIVRSRCPEKFYDELLKTCTYIASKRFISFLMSKKRSRHLFEALKPFYDILNEKLVII